MDINDNLNWDEGEPTGPLPIAGRTSPGEGVVVLVADPSMLINCMRGIEDNYRFVENLLGIENPDIEVLPDQSHLPGAPLDETKGTFRTARNALSTPLGMAGLVVAILTLSLMPVWRKRKGGNHG